MECMQLWQIQEWVPKDIYAQASMMLENLNGTSTECIWQMQYYKLI